MPNNKTRIMKRLLLALALVGLALATMGCNATVGVGVGVAYPGPWYGPWGGGIYVGGPIYP
jgi:predicted small secreted protein